MVYDILVKTDDIKKEDWLEQRKTGIGGSDVGAVCGVNKWKSAMSVYLEKIGEISSDIEENEKMYWGNTLENVVAKEFAKRTGKKVRNKKAIMQSKEYPFMIANIDRLVVGEKAGLECKTTGEYSKNDWIDDNIPDSYVLQCMHYMIVTGLKKWYIAVLIGGNNFIWKEINYDNEIANYLINIEKDFWQCVENKTPPAIDGSDSTVQVLKLLYPKGEKGSYTRLDKDIEILIAKREELAETIGELEVQKKELENKIKMNLGNYEIGKTENYEVDWMNREKRSIDSKRLKAEQPSLYNLYSSVTQYRQFSIKRLN